MSELTASNNLLKLEQEFRRKLLDALSDISSNLSVGNSTLWGNITGTLSNQTDLQTALNGKLDTTATTADVPDSTNKRYVTDADLVDIGNLSGTNTGDNATNTQYSGLAASKKSIATGNNYKFETTDASGNLQETTVTASRAVVTDANGLPAASATTATELGYVSGVTSAIQTQLNSKVAQDSSIISANMNIVTIAAGSTIYFTVFGTNANNLITTENQRQIASPIAFTMSKFYITTLTSQPGTGSLVLTMRKNGSSQSLTVTIAAGSAAGVFSDTSNSFSVAAGDLLTLQVVNNASSASAQLVGWTAIGTR